MLRNKENTELCVSLCQREDPRGTGQIVVSCIDLKGLQDGKTNLFCAFLCQQECSSTGSRPRPGNRAHLPSGEAELPHSSSCLELSSLERSYSGGVCHPPGDTPIALLHPGLADSYPKCKSPSLCAHQLVALFLRCVGRLGPPEVPRYFAIS